MQEPLQSTTIAGSPNGVLDPVAKMLEKHGSVRRIVKIVLYGRKDEASADTALVVQEAIHELGAEKTVIFSVRSWYFWSFWMRMKGALRPPILEIAGIVYSEGIVPDKEALKNHIRSLLI